MTRTSPKRRSSSPFDPGPEAWRTVAGALLRVVAELAGQGIQLVLFTFFRRERWRREIGAMVERDPLPAPVPLGASATPPARAAGTRAFLPLLGVAAFLGASTLLSGCAQRQVGSKSSWELLQQQQDSSGQQLGDTLRLLEGGNDWSDVSTSARLLARSKGETGFTAIHRDLQRTFAPPFNFQELRDTFRLLR